MSDDLSPLARVVMETYNHHACRNCRIGKICAACAEEIAQRVIGEWKRWVVTQHKDDNGYRRLW